MLRPFPRDLQLLRPVLAALLALLALSGCGGLQPAAPLTEPVALCSGSGAPPACREPAEAEERLSEPGLTVLGSETPGHGAQGVHVLTLASSRGEKVVFRAKFRAASTRLGFSDPRKELVAHALQKLLLAPRDWVIPPAAWVCFPVQAYRAVVDPAAVATYPATDCVAGVLSLWIEGGRSLEQAHDDGMLAQWWPLDVALFEEREAYRQSIADLNLMAHLITHGDSHWNQFILVGEGAAARMLLVDNSMAFDGYRNRDFTDGPWDWSKLHVPAVRRSTVEKLGTLEPRHFDALAAVAQRKIEAGRLVVVPPGEVTADHELGTRWRDGELQIGLTRAEITRLRRRARGLTGGLAAGTLRTF